MTMSGTFCVLFVNPLSANPTKCSDTLKQFVSKLARNCLSKFDQARTNFFKLNKKDDKKTLIVQS